MEQNENKLTRENVNDFTSGKLNPEIGSFDDFDKEALEGLKMAGEIQPEVFSRIDSKIDQEIVNRSKKRVRVVWMSVAACLVLVIGFYFWTKLNLIQVDAGEKQFTDIIKKDSSKVTEKIPELASAENLKKENEVKDKTSEPLVIKSDEQVEESVQLQEDISVDANSNGLAAVDQEQQMDEVVVKEINEDLEKSSAAAQSAIPQNTEGRTKSLENKKTEKDKKNSNRLEEQPSAVATRNENETVAAGFTVADSTTLNEVEVVSSTASFATYPGGQASLLQFYRQQIASTTLNSFSGKTVIISVFVNSQGKATKPKIVQGISDCSSCDQELIRVSKLMTPWNPAMSNGKPFGKRISFSLSF